MADETMKIYPEAVKAIKIAILKSRYLAARLANAEQLKLYFSVGGYVSANTRQGKWGTGAIEAISRSLQAELPGLRGFSEGNIKKMRIFFEEWSSAVIRSTVSNELESPANRQTLSGEIPAGANRQSAIEDLAEKDLPCGKSFDGVERFRDQVSKTLHKPNESREAHSLVIPEFTYAISPKMA